MRSVSRFITLLCIGTLTLVSCSKKNDPTKPEETALELSESEILFSQNSESKMVNITTNGVWYVTNNSEWITISPMQGKGNGAITISVSQNSTGQVREAYFSIAIDFETKNVVISQSHDDSEPRGSGNNNQTNGVIKAAFSISDSTQVYFSMGNLQYNASTSTWRFAEHQYDIIGSANKNISSSYNGWIDLFGWGTSGYNEKYPYMTNTDSTEYGKGNNLSADHSDYDWGVYNAISNGGNTAGMWRTLTCDEWDYIIGNRPNAAYLFGAACVNGVNGLILLPDNWQQPLGLEFKSGGAEYWTPDYYKTVNDYSLSEWSKMELNGAVFLPAAGCRYGLVVDMVDDRGFYWADMYCKYLARQLSIDCLAHPLNFTPDLRSRSYGCSVRLVQDVK